MLGDDDDHVDREEATRVFLFRLYADVQTIMLMDVITHARVSDEIIMHGHSEPECGRSRNNHHAVVGCVRACVFFCIMGGGLSVLNTFR